MLKFKVNNQSIERIDSFEVVADSCNYLKAEFEFTEEWTEDIIAVFCHDCGYYKVLLEGGQCTVPWEVIKAPGFTVAVVCGNRITSDTVMVDVKKSGFHEAKWGEEPSPDIYEQILDRVKVPCIGENGNWFQWKSEAKAYVDTGINAEATDGYTPQKGVDYVDGKDGYTPQKGIDYVDGVDGYTPQRGVDYWTEADKTEIKTYIDACINDTVAEALERDY